MSNDVCYPSCVVIDTSVLDATGYFSTRVSRHAIYDALLAMGVSATTGFLSSYLLGR